MVLALYEYEVDPNDQEKYIGVTLGTIKPFWEQKGCGYEVYRSDEDPKKFIKIMSFRDRGSLKSILLEKNEEAEKVVGLFKGFAKNIKRTIFQRIA